VPRAGGPASATRSRHEGCTAAGLSCGPSCPPDGWWALDAAAGHGAAEKRTLEGEPDLGLRVGVDGLCGRPELGALEGVDDLHLAQQGHADLQVHAHACKRGQRHLRALRGAARGARASAPGFSAALPHASPAGCHPGLVHRPGIIRTQDNHPMLHANCWPPSVLQTHLGLARLARQHARARGAGAVQPSAGGVRRLRRGLLRQEGLP
jgi:hypothetical protein